MTWYLASARTRIVPHGSWTGVDESRRAAAMMALEQAALAEIDAFCPGWQAMTIERPKECMAIKDILEKRIRNPIEQHCKKRFPSDTIVISDCKPGQTCIPGQGGSAHISGQSVYRKTSAGKKEPYLIELELDEDVVNDPDQLTAAKSKRGVKTSGVVKVQGHVWVYLLLQKVDGLP